MHMKAILKLLGGIQSNYWGDISPLSPPCFDTTAYDYRGTSYIEEKFERKQVRHFS